MSTKDVVKSRVTHVAGPDEKQPAAGVEDGSMEAENRKAKVKWPRVNKANPEEV